MKMLFAACACVLALTATRAESQTTASSRFGDLARITADPTGLLRDTSARAGPDYPIDLVRHDVPGAPVVAFVIDTTGRVEMRTASFLNNPRQEFASAICELLPRLRFQPFRVGDQKWRVLLVQVYIFNTWAVLDTAGSRAASRLARQSQEEFATKPIEQVIPQLDALPHCGNR